MFVVHYYQSIMGRRGVFVLQGYGALAVHFFHEPRDGTACNPGQKTIGDVHFLVVDNQEEGLALVGANRPQSHAGTVALNTYDSSVRVALRARWVCDGLA